MKMTISIDNVYSDGAGRTTIHKFKASDAVRWPELLDEFIDALRGAGYSLNTTQVLEAHDEADDRLRN